MWPKEKKTIVRQVVGLKWLQGSSCEGGWGEGRGGGKGD